jgi:hypothetical protein
MVHYLMKQPELKWLNSLKAFNTTLANGFTLFTGSHTQFVNLSVKAA